MVGAGAEGAMTLVFAATVVGFVAHERRATDPVVKFSLFGIRMFTFSVVSLLILATANSMATFLMPFYIQDVLRLSASFMGLIFLAAPVFTVVCAILSGRLDRPDRAASARRRSAWSMTLAAFTVGLLLRSGLDLALARRADGAHRPGTRDSSTRPTRPRSSARCHDSTAASPPEWSRRSSGSARCSGFPSPASS